MYLHLLVYFFVLPLISVSAKSVGPVSTIFTSEAQYCSQKQALAIDKFSFIYFNDNRSVSFDLSVRALASPPGETVFNVLLTAYGRTPVNYSVNICDELGSFAELICPIPLVDVSASGNIKLPDSFNFDLPEIAWYVPDIEANAKVTINDVETGEEVACILAQLSNGLTTHLTGATWAAAVILLLSFSVMIIHSLFPYGTREGPEWRFNTIVSYFQQIAYMGMISVNYPLAYQKFTLNFAWIVGLIWIKPITDSISELRRKTGGKDVTLAPYSFAQFAQKSSTIKSSSSLSYLSTGLSPSYIEQSNSSNNILSSVSTFIPGVTIGHLKVGDILHAKSASEVPNVQNPPDKATILGIAPYSEALTIPYENTFMTAFINFLLLICILLGILVFGAILLAIFAAWKKKDDIPEFSKRATRNLGYFASTNSLRMLVGACGVIFTFSFYQFTVGMVSGWTAIFFAVLSLLFCIASVSFLFWRGSVVAKRLQEEAELEKSSDHKEDTVLLDYKHSNGSAPLLRSPYKREKVWYFIPTMVMTFVKAAFIAFSQGHPWVQLIPLLVIELIYVISLIVFRPFRTKSGLAIALTIGILNIFCYALLFTAIPSVNLDRIVVTVCGFVVLAIQAIVAVILFIMTIFNLGYIIYRCWKRPQRKNGTEKSNDVLH